MNVLNITAEFEIGVKATCALRKSNKSPPPLTFFLIKSEICPACFRKKKPKISIIAEGCLGES